MTGYAADFLMSGFVFSLCLLFFFLLLSISMFHPFILLLFVLLFLFHLSSVFGNRYHINLRFILRVGYVPYILCILYLRRGNKPIS